MKITRTHVVIVATLAAITTLATRTHQGPVASVPPSSLPKPGLSGGASVSTPMQPTPDSSTAPTQPLDSRVDEKYETLLDALTPGTQSKLREVLGQRESAQTSSDIAQYERQISLLLTADDYALYEQLRESDEEQTQVRALTEELTTTSPLTDQQRRAVLLSKLQYQRAAQALELEAQVQRADRSAMEQGYAHDIALQGLEHYEHSFLEDVRPQLDSEQWRTLERIVSAANAARRSRVANTQ